MDVIKVSEVTKDFGGLRALNSVGFEVDSSDGVVGLIGPNGAGKTTLLNVISCFYGPDSGEILLEGRPLLGLRPHNLPKLGVSRTFQTPRICKALNVLENVVLGRHTLFRARLLHILLDSSFARSEETRAREESMEALRWVGLQEHAYEPAGILTGGQQRLLDFARIVTSKPRLALLDEPFAGLSSVEMDHTYEAILKLCREGSTVLLVEHNIDVVKRLCSKIVMLDFGVKISEGPPEEVLADPAVLRAYFGEAQSA